jgi:hypothetical protein
MRGPGLICVLFAMPFTGLCADAPQAEIASQSIRAKLYLPDASDGYYRATRFDWSGVIASLEWKGHNYFGKWFDRYDPKINDAITGPVEEFQTNGSALGYDEAKAGETFVKIGVGVLRKPDEPRYRQFATYEIVDNGKWSVKRGPDWIEFAQELTGPSGYAYVYRKALRLAQDKPVLTLEHSLKNTGRKPIETNVYEHNFYMLDGQPSGPDIAVAFPFPVEPLADLKGLAEIRGAELHYNRELQTGESVYSELRGYTNAAKDYDIRVENRKTGAAVRQTSDRPMSRLVFWSIRATVCPEAYVSMRVEPGKESTWKITYEFYETSGKRQ